MHKKGGAWLWIFSLANLTRLLMTIKGGVDMFLRKKIHDAELERIVTKMEEIKNSNKAAVKELEQLNKTMRDMEKRLKTLVKG